MHHKTQVRHDQLARGIKIVLVAIAAGQALLLFQAQDRNAIDLLDIGIQRAGSGWCEQMTGYEFLGHAFLLLEHFNDTN